MQFTSLIVIELRNRTEMTRNTSRYSSLEPKANLMLHFFMAITIFNQSTSARLLGDSSLHRQPPYNQQSSITFFIRSVLCNPHPPSPPPRFNSTTATPTTTTTTNPGGIGSEYPVPELDPNPTTGTSSGMQSSLSFPTATLEGLDLGAVTPIEEELLEGLDNGLPYIYLGRAKGAYVASSDDGSSHMMAMTAKFADGRGGARGVGGGGESKDSLSFYGIHRTDAHESHISVIGGSGKYEGANGYATVKAVRLGSRDNSTTAGSATAAAVAAATTTTAPLLQFTVYITY